MVADNWIPSDAWWWRRLAVGGWMLASLVLVKSYAGNLMSVLAVRYTQQPYQSLEDVVRDPSVTMIWQTNTSNVQFIRVRMPRKTRWRWLYFFSSSRPFVIAVSESAALLYRRI